VNFVELNIRQNAAKLMPRLLTNDQKQHQLEISKELKEQVSNDPHFLFKVVSGDESWIYGYDTEAKWQSSQWNCPPSYRPKKVQQVKSNVKSMLICFFDIDRIVHEESFPPGQTINAKFYCDVLRRLREDEEELTRQMVHEQVCAP